MARERLALLVGRGEVAVVVETGFANADDLGCMREIFDDLEVSSGSV